MLWVLWSGFQDGTGKFQNFSLAAIPNGRGVWCRIICEGIHGSYNSQSVVLQDVAFSTPTDSQEKGKPETPFFSLQYLPPNLLMSGTYARVVEVAKIEAYNWLKCEEHLQGQ